MISPCIHPTDERCIALWQEAFGDSEEYIRHALSLLADSSCAIALYDDQTRVAQAIATDISLGGRRGIYLYAICVAISHRGRGLMTRLLDECRALAVEREYSFILLIPCDKKMSDTYYRHGFELKIPICASASPEGDGDFYAIPMGISDKLPFDGDFERLHRMSGCSLSLGAFRYALETVSDSTDIFYLSKNGLPHGFAVFSKSKDRIFTSSPGVISKLVPGGAVALADTLGKEFSPGIDTADPLPR